MVEAIKSNSSGLLVPDTALFVQERRIMTSRDLMDRYGDYKNKTYRQLISYGIEIDRQGLDFFETAKMHKGSQALYFLEQKIGEHRIYLSYVPKNGKTTEHMHDPKYNPPVIEIYHPIGGNLGIFIDRKEHRHGAEVPVVVYPGQLHQVSQSEDNDSFNLIILKNSAGIPDEEVHIARPSG